VHTSSSFLGKPTTAGEQTLTLAQFQVYLTPLAGENAGLAARSLRCAMCTAIAESAWEDLVLSLHEFYAVGDIHLNPQLRVFYTPPPWQRSAVCSLARIVSFFFARTIREVHQKAPQTEERETKEGCAVSQGLSYALCSRLISSKLSAAETAAGTVACDVRAVCNLSHLQLIALAVPSASPPLLVSQSCCTMLRLKISNSSTLSSSSGATCAPRAVLG
jgi:hypothetical protein